MAEGLAYNSTNIAALADTIQDQLNSFNTQVDELFKHIDNLKSQGYWVGTVYDEFKANIENYRTQHINTLVSDIETWISTLNEAAAMADANTNKGIGIVG